MKNVTALIAIIIIVTGIFVFAGSGSTNLIGDVISNSNGVLTGNTISNNQVEVQVVKLSVQGGTYILNPSTIKKGIPVRIEADLSKMPGCSKSINIPAFNVRKNFNSGDNVVEFTPDKAGTFNIACSMNMYQGTFTVLENDGTKSTYVEQKSTSGGSCGAGGGGCGCGGGR